MPAKLLLDGYYYSRLVPWEDWHAGVRMHGSRVHYRRYFPDFNWLGCYHDNPIEFWIQSQTLTREDLESVKNGHGRTNRDGHPMWIAGTYELDGDRLLERYAPEIGGGYVWKREFLIVDDRIVGVGGKFALLFKPGSD